MPTKTNEARRSTIRKNPTITGGSAARLLLAAAFIFVVLIGGTDLGKYLTLVRAASAAVGVLLILAYIRRAPSEHDIVDKLALGALVLYLVGCAMSTSPRASFDAATTGTAFAAAFYLARGVVADPRGRRMAITVLGVTGATVSIAFLILWASVWLRWISISGAGPPPLDLYLPATPYRHYYLVGMLAALLLPATIQLARQRGIWPLGIAGSAASLAVAFMSGSRTVWLAGIAALLLCAVVAGRHRVPRPTWRWAVIGILAAGILLLVSGSIISRLGAGSTVALRLGIWDSSIRTWLESPLTGFGPGTFAAQLGLAGYYDAHQGLVPHAHNAAVQILVEAGLLGGVLVVVLGVAVVIGLARGRTTGVAPLGGMAFFAGTTLTDNPTVIAYLVAPAILWAALALPRRAPARQAPSRWAQASTLSLGAVVGVVSAALLLAAFTYDSASVSASNGNTAAVTDRLGVAAALDPANALYQRDLAVWQLAAGRIEGADVSIRRALELTPGDPAAWRAAALIALSRGDGGKAVLDAERAVEIRATDVLNQLTLAYVARDVDEDLSRHALAAALRTSPWITATRAWHGQFAAETAAALRAANASLPVASDDTNARAWLGAMIGDPPNTLEVGPIQAATAAVIGCDPAAAARYVTQLSGGERASADSLLVRILIARATGMPDHDLLTLAKLRWPLLAQIATEEAKGVSPLTGPADDIQLYGRLSLPAPLVGPSLPTSEGGLSAWLHDPRAAARLGAPESPLATCL
jgi:O-antigen ligase